MTWLCEPSCWCVERKSCQWLTADLLMLTLTWWRRELRPKKITLLILVMKLTRWMWQHASKTAWQQTSMTAWHLINFWFPAFGKWLLNFFCFIEVNSLTLNQLNLLNYGNWPTWLYVMLIIIKIKNLSDPVQISQICDGEDEKKGSTKRISMV